MGIKGSKMNVMSRREFDLAYFEVAVHNFINYDTEYLVNTPKQISE